MIIGIHAEVVVVVRSPVIVEELLDDVEELLVFDLELPLPGAKLSVIDELVLEELTGRGITVVVELQPDVIWVCAVMCAYPDICACEYIYTVPSDAVTCVVGSTSAVVRDVDTGVNLSTKIVRFWPSMAVTNRVGLKLSVNAKVKLSAPEGTRRGEYNTTDPVPDNVS
jgi:hypothetical protein